MPKTDYSMKSLNAALDVIESFIKPHVQSRSVSEISRTTGLNRNRVFRILTNLLTREYVMQDPKTRQYGLGLGFMHLGEAVRNRFDLLDMVRPTLWKLAGLSGDAAYLIMRFGNVTATVAREYGEHRIQGYGPIGETFPLHITASGKLFLAFLPEPERHETLHGLELTRYGRSSITQLNQLEAVLEKVRSQEYCISEEEVEDGLFTVAAPIRDHRGAMIAGLDITTPGARHDEQRQDRNLRLVIGSAESISKALGYQQ
jgi:IclR family KDG regulon transcriptional repressor